MIYDALKEKDDNPTEIQYFPSMPVVTASVAS